MKPDAIGGSGEHALVRFDYARLTRGKPRGIHPADLSHGPADARGLTCGDCRGGPRAWNGCDRLSCIREQRWYNSNGLPPNPRHRFVET
jgi:hypothetical protein